MRAWLNRLGCRSSGMKYGSDMMMTKLALQDGKIEFFCETQTYSDNQRSYIDAAKNRSPSYPMPAGTR